MPVGAVPAMLSIAQQASSTLLPVEAAFPTRSLPSQTVLHGHPPTQPRPPTCTHLPAPTSPHLRLHPHALARAPTCLHPHPHPHARAPACLHPQVLSVYMDCDRDSLIYLSDPIGPACHTNAPTCYFSQLELAPGAQESGGGDRLLQSGSHTSRAHVPLTTLFALERTIRQRRAAAEAAEGAAAAGGKPSWTARLLADPALCCKKVREEAGELCQAWEQGEGADRAASGGRLNSRPPLGAATLNGRPQQSLHCPFSFVLLAGMGDRVHGRLYLLGPLCGARHRPLTRPYWSLPCPVPAPAEAADLLYHSLVLLNIQGVSLEEVCGVLRSRFGTSGVEEKASRKQ